MYYLIKSVKKKEEATSRARIERALKDLPDFYEQLLEFRYGIVLSKPHSDEEIADVLNKQHSTNSGEPWDKKSVAAAIEAALEKLREVVGDKVVRQFLKQGDKMDCVAELNKAVREAEEGLKKSMVHQHVRHTKSGGVAVVSEHSRRNNLGHRLIEWYNQGRAKQAQEYREQKGRSGYVAAPLSKTEEQRIKLRAAALSQAGREVQVSDVGTTHDRDLKELYDNPQRIKIVTPLKDLTPPGDRDGIVQIEFMKDGKTIRKWVDGEYLRPVYTDAERNKVSALLGKEVLETHTVH